MPDPTLPTQRQERPQQALTLPEQEMLKWELDPNRESSWPMMERSWLAKWLFRILGLGDLFNHVDLELARVQRLMVLMHQLGELYRTDHVMLSQMFAQTNKVLAEDIIPQINRQTGAISSLLDRLQFYERNITLVGRSRKQYDKVLAAKMAERARAAEAERAAAEGVTVADQPNDPAQLPLNEPSPNGKGPTLVIMDEESTLTGLPDHGIVPADEATDGDQTE